MASVVRESGLGFDELRVRIDDLGKLKVFVGWLESARYDDNTSVAGIAAVQEFGSVKRGIPPRPFIRMTQEEKKKDWIRLVKKLAKAILAGKITGDQAIELIGLQVVGDIKQTIVNGKFQELSPVTIALRKHRNENEKIGGKFVGWVAAAIAAGETAAGELGDQTFGNKDPLRETGYMIATLTHESL